MTETTTMADRVAELGIRLTVKDGPTFTTSPDGWQHDAYRIQLRRRATEQDSARSITVPWMQGMAHQGPPSAADVLDAIVGDTVTYTDAADFDHFLDEYDTDTDDPKAVKAARKVWQALERQAPKVIAFLGHEFDAVAYDTERL